MDENDILHDQSQLNTYNSENAINDYDSKDSYKTHPMTDDQAKSIMDRIKLSFQYRNGMIIGTDNTWKDKDPTNNPHDREQNSLEKSIDNIERTKNISGEYNIEANSDDIPGDTSAGEIDASDANIIKAIDGIAIINSLLRINELDSNIDDIAEKSCNTIVKAFNNGKTYSNHTHTYYVNGNTECKIVYPNDTLDTDIVNAKNKYHNVITMNTESDDFIFDLTMFEDKQQHKDYVMEVLSSIDDIIKYVKEFTTGHIRAYADGTDVHQNITSAFDYYLLDYIIQMIDAENNLFSTLFNKYKKADIPISFRHPSLNDGMGEIDLATQRKQYNRAPFIGSMCNGSCIGLCFGSCTNTCNGCGGCTSYCGSYCGASCYGTCGDAKCESNCSGTCKGTCEGTCERTCARNCGDNCDDSCIETCKEECKGTCQSLCSTGCSDKCVNTCNTGCKTSCSKNCGKSCQNTSASKNPVTSPQPNNITSVQSTYQANEIYNDYVDSRDTTMEPCTISPAGLRILSSGETIANALRNGITDAETTSRMVNSVIRNVNSNNKT